MINVKLALSAVLAEIASWSSLWLLHNHSDAALLSYLAAHALASVAAWRGGVAAWRTLGTPRTLQGCIVQ